MAFRCGYDTDDLTDRQYHYFRKLNKKAGKGNVNVFALNFMASCIRQNISMNKFDNYDGDCDFLLKSQHNREAAEKLGINLEEIYST